MSNNIYGIKAIENPCGSVKGQWQDSSFIGWSISKIDATRYELNDAYKYIEKEYKRHDKGCGCLFEVVEL